jgi:hypothetical protein
LANKPSAQFANSSNKNNLQATGTGSALSASQGRVLVAQVSHCGVLRAKSAIAFFCNNLLNTRKQEIPIDELLTRTKFQWFLSKAPSYSFKKFIISTLLLLQGLHTMSLAKLLPDGLKA